MSHDCILKLQKRFISIYVGVIPARTVLRNGLPLWLPLGKPTMMRESLHGQRDVPRKGNSWNGWNSEFAAETQECSLISLMAISKNMTLQLSVTPVPFLEQALIISECSCVSVSPHPSQAHDVPEQSNFGIFFKPLGMTKPNCPCSYVAHLVIHTSRLDFNLAAVRIFSDTGLYI